MKKDSTSLSIKSTLLRPLLITFFFFAFAGILTISFFFIDPVDFRRIVFQPVREILLFQKELGAISHWDSIQKITIPSAVEVHIVSKDRQVTNIVADFLVPHDEGPSPAILLLHGSSPRGRKAGIIRLLAFRFQKEGCIVLSPDARGFGDTADPKDIENPQAWGVKSDVGRCLDYLLAYPRTDPKRVYVIGHSIGAGQALEGALEDSRVSALVLVGPPRYLGGGNSTLWKRVRFSTDRGLPRPIPEDVMKARISKTDISRYAKGLLNARLCKPILVIDGELEGDTNLRFLSNLVRDLSPSVTYNTLPRTGHYCGVRNLFGSESIYYRPDLFNPFVEIINNYLQLHSNHLESGTILATPVVNKIPINDNIISAI